MGDAAFEALALARGVIETAGRHVAAGGDVDANQVAAYDLAHAAAAVETAAAALEYGQCGEVERRIAVAFVADAVHDVATRLLGREPAWGVEPGALEGAMDFVRAHRSAEFLASLAGEEGSRDSTLTSRWCRTRSVASPKTRCGRSPSTSIARTATSPRT